MHGKSRQDIIRYIVKKMSPCEVNVSLVKSKISKFIWKFKELWKKSNRHQSRFESAHKKWLNGKIVFYTPKTPKTPRGRPRKPFTEASKRTRKNHVRELCKRHSADEIMFAAASSVQSAGMIGI